MIKCLLVIALGMAILSPQTIAAEEFSSCIKGIRNNVEVAIYDTDTDEGMGQISLSELKKMRFSLLDERYFYEEGSTRAIKVDDVIIDRKCIYSAGIEMPGNLTQGGCSPTGASGAGGEKC